MKTERLAKLRRKAKDYFGENGETSENGSKYEPSGRAELASFQEA